MGECLMYGLDLEARCLTSVHDEECVKFLVGTHNIKMDNQVCCLSIENDFSRIVSQSYSHPVGEIRAIASSPFSSTVFACSTADFRHSSPTFGIRLYEMDPEKRVLRELSSRSLDSCSSSFEWDEQTNRGCATTDHCVNLIDMEDGLKVISEHQMSGNIHAQVWSPHNNGNTSGIAIDRDILCMDYRTISEETRISGAHSYRALHLDFNPNLQHVIASCGDDGAVRIWDWRKPTTPLFSLKPHAHWVWQVRYHPVHDQLLLSTGSDACVVLSCVQSVSSDAETEYSNEECAQKLENGQLERIEEHEESIYAGVWSVCDPWTFASLSYDGRLVVSRVKRKHKYALMQL